MRARSIVVAALTALTGWAACAGDGTQARPLAPPPPAVTSGEFSAERAWEHLRALVEIGPRPSGGEGIVRAREYITGELADLGLETTLQTFRLEPGEDLEPIEIANVVGEIPGESHDLIVLAAPYDTRHYEEFEFVGANDGGSGVAVVLELGRVLAARPLPYTTWLLFFDGESLPVAPPGRTRRGLVGSTLLAHALAEKRESERIRLLVAFNRVCDADLRIARDLHSHRPYRQEFWLAADRLDYEDAFPNEGFESFSGSHLPFVERRIRRVVALSDTSFGGGEPPGIYANTEDDSLEHCAPESLAKVGNVTLEALAVITPRLEKIDAVAQVEDVSEGALDPEGLLRPEEPEEPEASEEQGEEAASDDGEAGASPAEAPSDEVEADASAEENATDGPDAEAASAADPL